MKMNVSIIIWLLLAALSTGYGFMVKAVGSGTGFYKVWLALAVLFVLFALASGFGIWGKLPGVLRKVVLGAIALGMVLLVSVEACIASGFSSGGGKNLDYLIVLGAQIYDNGPSTVLKYRLDKTVEYMDAHPDTVCIVSGGQGYNEPYPEAEGMAAYLEAHGIDKDRILREPQATNTVENIRYSMALMEDTDAPVGIVTNNFHVFRGTHIAKKQGLTNAEGIAADSVKAYLPNNMLREFFGVVKDVLQHNM